MLFIKSWLLIGFYTIACMGMGVIAFWLLSILFRPKLLIRQNIFVDYASSMIIGVAILGAIWTFISLSSLFSPAVIYAILLPLFLFGVWWIFKNRLRLKNDFNLIWVNIIRVGWVYKLIGLASLYFIFVIITNQLKVWPGDASAYYFALAKVISSSHTLTPLPGYYFGTFPSEAIMALGLHGELHMAALFSLGTDHFARYFDIPLLLAIILLMLGFLSMAGVRGKGLFIAPIIVLCTSAVIDITAVGKVDIYGIAFTLGAIFFAGLFFFNKYTGYLIFCGILIGTAITTKISYLVNMFPAVLLLLLWNTLILPIIENRKLFFSKFKQHLIENAGIVFIFSASILFSMVSYFFKNQIILGFWGRPFFLPKEVLASITILFPPKVVDKIVMTYPLALSFFDITANPGHFPPLILAFLPNLIIARSSIKLNSLCTASFIAGLLGIILWVIFFPGVIFVRYLFAALILLSPLVILATEQILDMQSFNFLKTTINVCILLSVFFDLINPAFVIDQINLINVYRNPAIPRCNFPECQQDQAINNDSKGGDRLLNLSDFRYWLRPDLIECSATTQETTDILSVPKNDYWETIYKSGIKYVSLNLVSKGLEDPLPWLAPKWMKISKIFHQGNLIVYRLDSQNAPYSPSTRCVQSKPPAWNVIADK